MSSFGAFIDSSSKVILRALLYSSFKLTTTTYIYEVGTSLQYFHNNWIDYYIFKFVVLRSIFRFKFQSNINLFPVLSIFNSSLKVILRAFLYYSFKLTTTTYIYEVGTSLQCFHNWIDIMYLNLSYFGAFLDSSSKVTLTCFRCWEHFYILV